MKTRVLIVDDELDMLSTCRAALAGNDIHVHLEPNPTRVPQLLRAEHYDLLVSDIKMPQLDGIALLGKVHEQEPELPVLLMTAFPEMESAVLALRMGAVDYLLKPFHPDDFLRRVLRALEERRLRGENRLLVRQVEKSYQAPEIVGRSTALARVLAMLDKVGRTSADVLLRGESGTGKELFARRLHALSGRLGHFVPVDCGAIPEHLLENEFFGHERGSYTGAEEATPGLLEFADGGSFFLDEVCEMPLAMQAKLLRALQERQFRRVGGSDLRRTDVRVIAATNRDIQREVREGRFREDLFYRLNVVMLEIPPLRERAGDVPVLVESLLPRIAKEMGKPAVIVEPAALEILSHYPWPGNVRELQNILKKAVLLCEGGVLSDRDLPEALVTGADSPPEAQGFIQAKKRCLLDFERGYFEDLLDAHQGNVRAAAEAAGLPLSNLYWYLKRHGLKPQSYRA